MYQYVKQRYPVFFPLLASACLSWALPYAEAAISIEEGEDLGLDNSITIHHLLIKDSRDFRKSTLHFPKHGELLA